MQAGLSLCWSHIPHCGKSHATAHIMLCICASIRDFDTYCMFINSLIKQVCVAKQWATSQKFCVSLHGLTRLCRCAHFCTCSLEPCLLTVAINTKISCSDWNVFFMSSELGESVLNVLGCLVPFLENDLLDSLPYTVASTLAIFPPTLHKDTIDLLCSNLLPMTLGEEVVYI